MAIINLDSLTLNPQEVADFNKIIVKATLENPALKALHNVQEGIQMKEQIVLASKLGMTGLKSSGCTRQESGAQSIFTEKYWEPVGIEDTFKLCQAELDGLFKAYYSKIQKFEDMYNIGGSDEAKFLATLVSNSAIDTIFRAVWFGDTNVSAATASASGVADAASIPFLNYFDGLWAQIFAGVTAGTIGRLNIASLPTQISASDAYDTFMSMYKYAPAALRSNPDAKFYVTGQLFMGLVEYMQTESVNGGDLTVTSEGIQTVKFMGKEVVNMETVWDDTIKLFINNTTDEDVLYPNRIVFTTPDNIPVGTLNQGDFDNVEAFYDKVSRNNIISYGFTLDSKVLDEGLIAVAY